jgi:hypothetical protein
MNRDTCIKIGGIKQKKPMKNVLRRSVHVSQNILMAESPHKHMETEFPSGLGAQNHDLSVYSTSS